MYDDVIILGFGLFGFLCGILSIYPLFWGWIRHD